MDTNNLITQQNEINNQNIPIILNHNNYQNLNMPLLQEQTNTIDQINYNINKINDNHINNYGYFYINNNPFMQLINQEKIKIYIQKKVPVKLIILGAISFFLFGFGGFLTAISKGVLFFIPIIGFIGWVITIICCGCTQQRMSFIFFNKTNSNIEVNIIDNKVITIPLNSIERIIMEDTDENSVFYFENNLNEKIKFLELPFNRGIPFKEGEEILNDWCRYLKNKQENKD